MSPTPREIAAARAVLKADRAGRRANRAPRLPAKPKAAHGRERDAAYLSWLHDGLSCIACLVLAPTGTPIEAAHQKIQSAARGLNRKLGVRPDDWQTLPLCESHHRKGRICCDPAQAKFWRLIGLTPERIADFCRELHDAFKSSRPGEPIVRRYAAEARPNPPSSSGAETQ